MQVKTFLRLYGYTNSVMKRKPFRADGEDLRDYPTYTIPEAATFLGVPVRTLYDWFSGNNPILSADGRVGGFPLLSFKDALDVYALFLLRSRYKFSMHSIRTALKALPRHTRSKHAISEHISVFRDHLLLERPKHGNRERQVVDLSKSGDQLAIPDIVDVFSNRVLRSSSGKMITIFPWRLWEQDQSSRPVQIDPDVMSGRLVIAGTRIPVRMIQDRARRGQSPALIADDYGLPVESIEKALRHVDQKAA